MVHVDHQGTLSSQAYLKNLCLLFNPPISIAALNLRKVRLSYSSGFFKVNDAV